MNNWPIRLKRNNINRVRINGYKIGVEAPLFIIEFSMDDHVYRFVTKAVTKTSYIEDDESDMTEDSDDYTTELLQELFENEHRGIFEHYCIIAEAKYKLVVAIDNLQFSYKNNPEGISKDQIDSGKDRIIRKFDKLADDYINENNKYLNITIFETIKRDPIEFIKKQLNSNSSNTELYYKKNSQEFFESTVNADVSPLYEHFLKYVPDGGYILDFGCGSGRDTKAFLDMGYKVDAIDGSEELCKLASEYAGVEVKCMDFMDLNEVEKYDAIWACASVLHVSGELLPDLFAKMRDAVVDNGIIYMSFKYGESDIERDGRYFTDMTSEKFVKYLNQVTGLSVVEEWFSEDVRKEKSLGWYNVILRKG